MATFAVAAGLALFALDLDIKSSIDGGHMNRYIMILALLLFTLSGCAKKPEPTKVNFLLDGFALHTIANTSQAGGRKYYDTILQDCGGVIPQRDYERSRMCAESTVRALYFAEVYGWPTLSIAEGSCQNSLSAALAAPNKERRRYFIERALRIGNLYNLPEQTMVYIRGFAAKYGVEIIDL